MLGKAQKHKPPSPVSFNSRSFLSKTPLNSDQAQATSAFLNIETSLDDSATSFESVIDEIDMADLN